MQCGILGYELAEHGFSSVSMHHMLDMFCVWNLVIYLGMVEPKGMMCDSN